MEQKRCRNLKTSQIKNCSWLSKCQAISVHLLLCQTLLMLPSHWILPLIQWDKTAICSFSLQYHGWGSSGSEQRNDLIKDRVLKWKSLVNLHLLVSKATVGCVLKLLVQRIERDSVKQGKRGGREGSKVQWGLLSHQHGGSSSIRSIRVHAEPDRCLRLCSANGDLGESHCVPRALVHSFCHSINKYLLSTYCVPGTVHRVYYVE